MWSQLNSLEIVEDSIKEESKNTNEESKGNEDNLYVYKENNWDINKIFVNERIQNNGHWDLPDAWINYQTDNEFKEIDIHISWKN